MTRSMGDCLYCREPVTNGGHVHGTFADSADGSRKLTIAHHGCEAVHIIGHDYGVCRCTGWDTSTKAAGDELLRRLFEDRERRREGNT